MPTVDHCPGCPYREFGPAIGPGGDPTSPIVLVGEAPGATEVDEGEPFRRPAGDVLWRAGAEAGLLEGNLFITNSVACRPRNPVKPTHTPSPDAIRACHGRLAHDISAHDRAVIVALGATAIRAVTGVRGFPVTKKGPGTELPSEWGRVVPTLHPAYVLRRGLNGPEYQMLVADPKHARRITDGPGV
jgi:uracil-DNA glycosylase family 4